MAENISFIIAFIIGFVVNIILIILFILNLIWLEKLMKNSNKKELSFEKINSCIYPYSSYKRKLIFEKNNLINKYVDEIYTQNYSEDIKYKDYIFKDKERLIRILKSIEKKEMTKTECDYYITLFSENGAIKTFNIEIDRIHSLSKALFIIIIISLFVSCLMIIFVCITSFFYYCCNSKNCVSFIAIFIVLVETIGKIILVVLHLVYFVLLARTHKQGKFNDFQNFGNCYNIKTNVYEELYSFVFKVEKNYTKIYYYNIFIIIINIIGVCSRTFLGYGKDEK